MHRFKMAQERGWKPSENGGSIDWLQSPQACAAAQVMLWCWELRAAQGTEQEVLVAPLGIARRAPRGAGRYGVPCAAGTGPWVGAVSLQPGSVQLLHLG